MTKYHPLKALAAVAVTALVATSAAKAQLYIEQGDAGSTAATASPTGATNGAALTAVGGNLSTVGDMDLFLINISNPSTFSASTSNPFTTIDTQIYLFDLAGNPVYLNDDASGLSLQSTLPAGSVLGPQSAGQYILGISLSGVDPVNAANTSLFATGTFSTDLRGPAPGGLGPVTGAFNNSSSASPGFYFINLTGASTVAPIPEPAVTVALGAGALGLLALRRRQRA